MVDVVLGCVRLGCVDFVETDGITLATVVTVTSLTHLKPPLTGRQISVAPYTVRLSPTFRHWLEASAGIDRYHTSATTSKVRMQSAKRRTRGGIFPTFTITPIKLGQPSNLP